MIRPLDWIARSLLGGIVAAGVASLVWVLSFRFEGCSIEPFTETQKAGVTEYIDIAKWIMSISIGFIGLFGSMALGLKEGPKFTSAVWMILIAAICAFAFAAYLSLFWRAGVAEAFYLGCPRHISSPMIQARFAALTYVFLAGIGILATGVCVVILERIGRVK
jgi:hypothetical protein